MSDHLVHFWTGSLRKSTGLESDICLINQAVIPFCLNEKAMTWYGASGYSGSIRTNDYYTPDGQRGNLRDGPCPGSYYEEDSSGGCTIVPASRRSAETQESTRSSTTRAIPSTTLTSMSDSAAQTPAGSQTSLASERPTSVTVDNGAIGLTKRWAPLLALIAGFVSAIQYLSHVCC
jgi:hypothetical protein